MMDEDFQDRIMRTALTESVAGGNPYEQDIKVPSGMTYAPQIPGFDEKFSDTDLLLMRHLKGSVRGVESTSDTPCVINSLRT